MVSRKAHRRKTISLFILVDVIVAAIVCLLLLILKGSLVEKPVEEGAEQNSAITEVEVEKEPEVIKPPKIDFQPLVDEWVGSISGNKSVLIYDLERDEVVGAYNATESYSTASLYKLFVVYEGYRRVQAGEWQGDSIAGSTGHTIVECLDLSIRESYSPCAETLWGMIGHDELDRIIETEFGITNSDISSLVSNPEDIMQIMKLFYTHSDIVDETLVAKMKDSFLNQPTTTYNWRQGLPSGFSRANVYNKVGWDWNGKSWNIYHDAAIVEFPELNRHFIVVVMTNQVPYQRIREFGTKIENLVLSE